jgi:hypothetical protein
VGHSFAAVCAVQESPESCTAAEGMEMTKNVSACGFSDTNEIINQLLGVEKL